MKKNIVAGLRWLIGLFGGFVAIFLLWEPHVEGRNAHATFAQIYFQDAFLLYVYVCSIPFFIALVQVQNILKYIEQNQEQVPAVTKSIQIMKRCVLFVVGSVVASGWFMIDAEREDRPQGVFLRAAVIFSSIVAMVAIRGYERMRSRRKAQIVSV